jgi:hypothetical protein
MKEDTLLWRFEEKYEIDTVSGCWNWTAAHYPRGYGMIQVKRNGKWSYRMSHRVSWELFNGEIPNETCVCHKCDNPKCVNPAHLFLGTQLDNLRDMKSKGREGWSASIGKGVQGSKHYRTRFSDQDVLNIRSSDKSGVELAKEFGVSRSLISNIRNNKRWKHLLSERKG